MYTERFASLAAKCQAGEKKALTQLLRLAHTPVSYLCRKLLGDEPAAQTLTREILSALPRQLGSLQDPAGCEKWICRITASRCTLALAQLSRTDTSDTALSNNPPEISATELDEVQTALLVDQLVDQLPEEPRLCLLLYSCARLKLKGISQLTGFPESAVLEQLNHAQKVINTQLRQYHRMGIHFAAIPALSSLLRTAMYSSQDPKAATAMVSGILEVTAATPASRRSSSSKGLLIAATVAAALLVLMLIAIFFLERSL